MRVNPGAATLQGGLDRGVPVTLVGLGHVWNKEMMTSFLTKGYTFMNISGHQRDRKNFETVRTLPQALVASAAQPENPALRMRA
jgi:hypothetical protein